MMTTCNLSSESTSLRSNRPAAIVPRLRYGLWPAVLWLLVGCVTLGQRDHATEPELLLQAPPYYLRAELDDPFVAVEAAMKRLVRAPLIETEVVPSDDIWSRLISQYQFAQCQDNPEAANWTQWFGEREEYMERVLGRARPWISDIANELERRGMPGELALLPIVESAYDPFAYSHGRASGTWQFLEPTARWLGLEINDWYDGRRDVYASTRAALDYLQQLSDRFDGDWDLALAAYNGGQGRVGRAIEANSRNGRPTDWRSLRLPRETRAYIPKLHGLACLFAEPEQHPFQVPSWNDEALIAHVELPGPIDVVELSYRSDLEITELVALNPGLNGHLTSPTGPHHLIVPNDRADRIREVLPTLSPGLVERHQRITVQSGDTLSGLAQRHGTSVRALRATNQLNGDLLRIGQTLQLPGQAEPNMNPALADRYQELAHLQQRLLPTQRFQHRVRPGESLWTIARRYGVSIADLRRWNRLGENNLIRPGQQLLVNLEASVAMTPSVPAATIATPQQHTVRQGESLWLIARRYNVSMQSLMASNGLNGDSVLQPGQRLTLPGASQ